MSIKTNPKETERKPDPSLKITSNLFKEGQH